VKEHLIRTWCDGCVAVDMRTEGETHTIKIDGKAAEVDLCERHVKQLIEPLLAVIEERGVPVKPAPRPASNGRPCPFCDSNISTASIVGHVYTQHAGGLDKKPPTPAVCPECGDANPDARSMGAHRSRAHGWSALSEAIAIVNARNGRTA
jgi:hypothetical protein